MENQKKSDSGLKVIIAILALLLAGSLYYNYKNANETKAVAKQLSATQTEKETVMSELQTLKATYEAAIAESTTISEELVVERDKVVALMKEMENAKGDAASMSKYKTQYLVLQKNMKLLMEENDILKKQNGILTTQRDSTAVVLDVSRKSNDSLQGQNRYMAKMIDKASKLTVLNMKAVAFKTKSSGKLIATEKAGSADVLKISFTIAENPIAKAGGKAYYVQVIDAKNNVLGEKQTITFGDEVLSYSFVSNVQYDNKTVEVSENLPGKTFEKGTYFVNVFDKNELVSATSFILK